MPAAFVPHRYGIVMVVFCLTVFVVGWAIFNLVFLAQILPELRIVSPIPVFGVLFNSVWCLAVWSYLRLHCSAAGGNTDHWRDFVRSASLRLAPSLQEWQPGQATFCTKCAEARPERAHHCSASGVCAQRMDHYCPWTANCVGFQNHKFFLLLATYNWLSVTVFLVITLPTTLYALREWHFGQVLDRLHIAQVVLVLTGCVIAAACTYLLGEMVLDHMSKACKNITSIEDEYDNMPNPFDLGNWYLNLSQVMGAFGPDWFVPVMPWRPLSDGISFARAKEMDQWNLELHGEDKQEPEEIWSRRYSELLPTSMPSFRESEEEEEEEEDYSDGGNGRGNSDRKLHGAGAWSWDSSHQS